MRLKDSDKEEAIRRAAASVTAQRGLAALTMAAVAAEAGLSPSSLYVYFPDKESMIIDVFRNVTIRLVQTITAAFRPDMPYKANLRSVWAAYLRFRIENADLVDFYDQVKKSGQYREEALRIRGTESEPGLMLIRMGQQQGLLKEMDEHLLLASIAGMSDRFSAMFAAGDLTLDEENIAQCFTLLWDCIKS